MCVYLVLTIKTKFRSEREHDVVMIRYKNILYRLLHTLLALEYAQTIIIIIIFSAVCGFGAISI